MGMGLAIARKILQNHHGAIWLESEEGIGSSFYFTVAKSVAKTTAKAAAKDLPL